MASRLAQMQARFQQKQMEEKEHKLLKLYESQQQRAFERVGRSSAGSNTSNASTTSLGSTGGGKVRAMFDERRQKAGIDKSYPLKPLDAKNNTRSVSLGRQSNGTTKTVTKTTSKKIVSKVTQNGNSRTVVDGGQTVQREVLNNNYKNDSYTRNGYNSNKSLGNIEQKNSTTSLLKMLDNHNLNDILDNQHFPNEDDDLQEDYSKSNSTYLAGKLSNVGGKLPSQLQKEATSKVSSSVSSNRQNSKGISNNRNNSNSEAKQSASKSLKPKVAPRTSSAESSPSSSPTKEVMASNASSRAPLNNRPSSKQKAKSSVVRDDLAECRYCGRRFATDRLGKHEDICGKTAKKKRKIYDSTKHRLQGTELEPYIAKGPKKGAGGGKVPAKVSSTGSKSNWRRTHEEFIAAIRSAKQMQAHIAKGGKLSDLPPPPPSSNPDYVQCPHCGRRFNEAAAERHIPKCATFQFNKKPAAKPGKR